MTRMESAGEDIMSLTHKLLEEGIDTTDHLEEIERAWRVYQDSRSS